MAAVEKLVTSQQNRISLMKSKRTVLISTFNVRTLNKPSKINELIYHAQKYSITIMAIQEHRIVHDEPLKYHLLDENWLLITSTATRNSVNASVGGVGLLLSPLFKNSLENVETINSRIMIATFSGNPKSTIISTYSPTNNSNIEVIEEYYTELTTLLRRVPKHNMLLLCGDMNAQVGTDAGSHSYHSKNNRNGDLLCEIQQSNNPINLKAKFQKRSSKKWTFTYANKTKAQLDHILINSKWKSSAINCAAYNTFETITSDHKIVTAKVRLCLRTNKKRKLSPKYDWGTILTDDYIKQQYSASVQNRFETLQQQNIENDTNLAYQNITLAHKAAAAENIPVIHTSKRPAPWHSKLIEEKRKNVINASKVNRQNPSDQNKESIKVAQEALDKEYIKEKEKYINNKIAELNNAHINSQTKLVLQSGKEVTLRNKSKVARLKGKTTLYRLK